MRAPLMKATQLLTMGAMAYVLYMFTHDDSATEIKLLQGSLDVQMTELTTLSKQLEQQRQAAKAPPPTRPPTPPPTNMPTPSAAPTESTFELIKRLSGPLGWLPDVIANLDKPDKDKPGALIVRTNEYMKQRRFWESMDKAGRVGQHEKLKSKEASMNISAKAEATLPPLSPSMCYPPMGHVGCDVLGDMAQMGKWQKTKKCEDKTLPVTDRALCNKQGLAWVPSSPTCGELCTYTPPEACAVVGRSRRIVIMGDSLMRQLFEAFMCTLSGDYDYGALDETVTEAAHKKCKGDRQFNDKLCQGILITNLTHNKKFTKGPPCGGKANVDYIAVMGPFSSDEADKELKERHLPDIGVSSMQTTMRELNQNDVLILGVGLWSDLDWKNYIKKFYEPTLKWMRDPTGKDVLGTYPQDIKNKHNLPQIIFIAPHTVHVDASYKGVSPKAVLEYNEHVIPFLRKNNIPVFGTINLSLDAAGESYDGLHYVGSVNYAKTSLILRYIEDQHLQFQKGFKNPTPAAAEAAQEKASSAAKEAAKAAQHPGCKDTLDAKWGKGYCKERIGNCEGNIGFQNACRLTCDSC